MRPLLLRTLLVLLAGVPAGAGAVEAQPFRALVFSRTAGFRHASIPDGVAAIRQLGAAHGFAVDATEDAAAFTADNLARYDVVIFLNTTGDVLDAARQSAFEAYVRDGGGFVGVHAAADTEYEWPFYGGLVGAYFASHPDIQQATVKVADRAHPSSGILPKRWSRTDEWYNFRQSPRGRVHVLATLDETTYGGGTMAPDHPIAWCQAYEGGRSWYTAGGHTAESYREPLFLEHLLGGIRYAAGAAEGDCRATVGAGFEKVILEEEVNNGVDLAVAPDGRVLFVEIGGAVKLYDPASARTTTAARLDVYEGNEDGLIGIVLDPGFAQNGWLYLFYSPAAEPEQRLARFTLTGGTLDLSSEKILLEVPVTREECCHSAGSMAFDAAGDLFVALGDDTNPFASDGYAPIDERPGRAAWDAQRSSASTSDLRGKILRITPQPDGTYTVPAGNLFPGGAGGRPEIYAMGLRNPYRISVDPETGWLYWGDVGPDAQGASAARGPQGLDEWNQARGPGNYGWPYCIGPNRPYRDYDFAARASGAAFDCAAPVNESPNNTGARALPPARPAWIWYPYGASPEFPEILPGNGRTAMAGPVYHYDAQLASETKLPAYYDDTLFLYEWSRNYMLEVKLDDDGNVLEINPFAPGIPLVQPISMKLGPDGALYLLEWGSGFGRDNPLAKLVRIDYRGGPRAPVAVLDAEPTSGPVPLTVRFSAAGSHDPDPGDVLGYGWDFDADGTVDAAGVEASHTYTRAGDYTAQLVVTDPAGRRGVASVSIVAGNTRPVVTLSAPADGGFFAWGDAIPFRAAAQDAEDGGTGGGGIDCGALTVQLYTGHDTHSHPGGVAHACDGAVAAPAGHGGDADDLFLVLEAGYTDAGAGGAGPLTARVQHLLHPRRLQAEHYSVNGGVQLEDTGDAAGGGRNVGWIDHGDYLAFAGLDLRNIGFLTYRVASAGAGGRIEVRVDAPDGPLVSTAHVEPTGGWQLYRDVTVPVADPGGKHDLFFVFTRNPGDEGLFNVNWIDFQGSGVADRTQRGPEGLTAVYFDGPGFSGERVTRTDPQINFNWASDPPVEGFGADGFSVRWTGQVEAEFGEAYTFYARSDDGMRVWVDGRLLIDRWVDQPVTEVAGAPVPLEAGRRYDLKVEFYDDAGGAQAHLSWRSGSTPKSIVPARLLYPSAGSGTGTDRPAQPPQRLELEAFPNPFSARTRLTFTLPEDGPVRLELFDLTGRRAAVLLDEHRQAGTGTVVFEAGAMTSGLYLCRLTTPSGTRSRKLVIVR